MVKKPTASKVPETFAGKLVYFHGIGEESYAHPLNDLLVLISEDEPLSEYVFGYVLNTPMEERFGRFMRRESQPLTDKFNFIQLLDSDREGFDFVEHHFITFLMRKNGEKNPYPVHSFGEFFEAYTCEDMEEARHVGQNLAHRKNTIVLYGQLLINHQTIVALTNQGKCAIREADPDIVFNSSGYMRALTAFPNLVPKF
jgi:hypothetical protein